MQQSPSGASTAALALADGTIFRGIGFGGQGQIEGELVFNTAMTGYQEILTDPSYAGQIITFTFPHIGNVGTNSEDIECVDVVARGLVVRNSITPPSNWRNDIAFDQWLQNIGIIGISGLDTRRLTAILRDKGAQNAALAHQKDGEIDIEGLRQRAAAWSGLEGMDLVPDVTCQQRYSWDEALWQSSNGYQKGSLDGPHIVALDYGVKRNILRSLADLGCRITVLPATAASAEVDALEPDGIFLSNGPGDPAATGEYAVPVIRDLLKTGKPIFGICLGHQMLGLALGAKTEKLPFGHHGANHPVKDLTTGQVEITSQNHGFGIADQALPDNIEVTHRSLFDGTIQGIRVRERPVFSVQYHPEASPGPMDSHYLFQRFLDLVGKHGSDLAATS